MRGNERSIVILIVKSPPPWVSGAEFARTILPARAYDKQDPARVDAGQAMVGPRRSVMRIILRAALAALIATLLAGLAASSALARARSVGYVGTVRGTHAFVAVVTHGSHVTAYVCDSKKIAQWFTGSVKAGKAILTSSGGYVLRVTVANGKATGSVQLPGARRAVHRFRSTQDAKSAGLYRGVKTVAGKRYVGGWIVLPDGRQRGEVLTGATDVASPILDPSHPTVDVKKGKKRPLIVIIAILIG